MKLLGATAIAGPAILRGTTAQAATSEVIKIGHVSPQTGALAPFAEADPFILDQIRTALAKGITNGGVTYEVQIISKDSQSKTNRASEVAADLILKEKVDLLVASSTPETTNPVADQAEANEVPCKERAIAALRGHGIQIEDESLAHLSPIGWEHINFLGIQEFPPTPNQIVLFVHKAVPDSDMRHSCFVRASVSDITGTDTNSSERINEIVGGGFPSIPKIPLFFIQKRPGPLGCRRVIPLSR
jgi:hypothetical protein